MSTPDASLSPQERAALASLEAAAAAADPQLAHRLRGSGAVQAGTLVPRLMAYLVGRGRYLLRHGWWGAPVFIVGLVLMILGLSSGVAMSVAGALVATAGLRLVGEALLRHFAARRAAAAPTPD